MMRQSSWIGIVAALAAAAQAPHSIAQQINGQKIFESSCATCHTVSADQRALMGPGLFNVVGRKVGSVPDFGYSSALANLGRSGKHWDKADLDLFLTNPSAYAPGAAMPVALQDKAQRAAVIDYLATRKGQVVASAPAAAGSTHGGEHWSDDMPGRIHETRLADLPKPFATPSAGNGPRAVPRPQNVLPQVPAGFKANLWATDPDRGRKMLLAPNGDVFLSSPGKRLIKVFRSATGEKAESVTTFATDLDRPYGMAFWPAGPNPQYLYVANVNSIVRFPYKNGDIVASAAPEVVVAQVAPTSGGHTTRTLVFSADGKTMILSVGSASNVAEHIGATPPEPLARWEAKHGMGAAWGDETDRALVLAYDADGKNKRSYATGLRNCVGLYLYPRTGDVMCSVNERDLLGDNLPPDYVTRVKQGGFYGWPWYYLGNNEDPRLQGQRPDLRAKVTTPDMLLTAHSAPLGMAMYEAMANARAAFPKEYDGDIFLALHGSWNRETRTGSKVVRVFMKDGVPTGQYQDFMTGFVVSDKEVWGRPASVLVQNDGSLLVDDDLTGEIWRVAPK